jgi:hypothetical protein
MKVTTRTPRPQLRANVAAKNRHAARGVSSPWRTGTAVLARAAGERVGAVMTEPPDTTDARNGARQVAGAKDSGAEVLVP